MLQDVTIVEGHYRGQELNNIKCKLNGSLKLGARGWFGHFIVPGKGPIRIHVPSEDSVTYEGKVNLTSDAQEEETEEQIIKRIEDRFDIFKYTVNGIASGDIRALIVSGASGIGKTETVSRQFETQHMNNSVEYEIVRGNIVSSYQLYQLLYNNSNEDDILILDDCDAILKDINGLNILKAALESGDRPRIISYKSQAVLNLGMPTEFEYKGRMIFITNENFQRIVDKENTVISKHMKAIIDRSLYLDLLLHSKREVYCRVKQMVQTGGLLANSEIDKSYHDKILLWIKDNMYNIRSMSLRTPIHVADMVRTNESNWQGMASAFLLRQGS